MASDSFPNSSGSNSERNQGGSNSNNTTDNSRIHENFKLNEILGHRFGLTHTSFLGLSEEQIQLLRQDTHLSRLHSDCATDATFNSTLWDDKPRCLLHTRIDLLLKIKNWSTNPDDTCIFWLNGIAVAPTCAEEGRLRANFFFSKDKKDLSDGTKFVTTLAIQLGYELPDIISNISQAIAEIPNILQRCLHDQWEHLIECSLSKIREEPPHDQPLSLVIDSLDECEDEDHIESIIKLLASLNTTNTTNTTNTIWFRVLITSRPEPLVKDRFYTIRDVHQEFVLHHISSDIVKNDMLHFLPHELEKSADARIQMSRRGGQVKASSSSYVKKQMCCLFMLQLHVVLLEIRCQTHMIVLTTFSTTMTTTPILIRCTLEF
ncbi:hypothetical protein BDD12DRAFT_806280 [Trichophaea hybrida]|nr:hypothetical protein BDD12DRAFT_806280 [Trichophaea hybrida]